MNLYYQSIVNEEAVRYK